MKSRLTAGKAKDSERLGGRLPEEYAKTANVGALGLGYIVPNQSVRFVVDGIFFVFGMPSDSTCLIEVYAADGRKLRSLADNASGRITLSRDNDGAWTLTNLATWPVAYMVLGCGGKVLND